MPTPKKLTASQTSKLAALLKKGKKQGYLVMSDIMEVFTNTEKSVDELDKLYAKLLDKGIEVLETQAEEVKEQKKTLQEQLDDLARKVRKNASDPVRMYLTEIGKV